MIRFLSIIIAVFFCFHTTGISAQVSPGKQKNTTPKKAVKEEEKIEEVIEDAAISTIKVDTTGNSDHQRYSPVKRYDTVLAPNDALTAALHQLIDEIKMIDITVEGAREVLSKNIQQNTNAGLNDFYARFSTFLGTPEVSAFYRNIFTKIYRKHFTLEEVREMQKFYQTDLGKKSMKLMNVIMQESMTEGSKFGEYWGEKIYLDMQNEK